MNLRSFLSLPKYIVHRHCGGELAFMGGELLSASQDSKFTTNVWLREPGNQISHNNTAIDRSDLPGADLQLRSGRYKQKIIVPI